MDKYRRVENSGPIVPKSENEIRITTAGTLGKYVGYAIALLEQKGASDIILKGMGRAISKTVTIAEMIKRRLPELHQNTETSSADINTIWEPLEEGLSTLETTRHVSTIAITLSRTQLNTSSAGYQSPLRADQLKPLPGDEYECEGEDSIQNGRGRGRGRGWATGTSEHVATLSSQNTDTSGWNQVRGRRGGRGRGRGWETGRAGNLATLGHQNADTSGYPSSSANGWNQGRGNDNHYRINVAPRRIGGSGSKSYYGNVNRDSGGRGRGSFGGGN